MPASRDFVPKDHVSRFIVGLVRESLDLKAIMGSYGSGLGQPPFDPRMMVSLLLHGYASGLYSSRRIAETSALVDAGKALFGSEFAVIPEFSLAAGQRDELATALAASVGGDLFNYVTETAKVDFPVGTGCTAQRASERSCVAGSRCFISPAPSDDPSRNLPLCSCLHCPKIAG